MSSLLFVLIGLALAAAAVVAYLAFKKKKVGAAVKESQLEALGLGDKNVSS